MEHLHLDPTIRERVSYWLEDSFDPDTKSTIQRWVDQEDTDALIDAFYCNLEFGTGGMRGIMGPGTNRMNRYTVGAASKGLATYILGNSELKEASVAIAYDSRNNSKEFAEIAAAVFSNHGIKVFLFSALRPTPELSFAVRYLKCTAGVVLTASHNPKEYNGYKVYWSDGGQIVAPQDKDIVAEVKKVKEYHKIDFAPTNTLILSVDQEVDRAYLDAIKGALPHPDLSSQELETPIVVTPIHGTSVTILPQLLSELGFQNIHLVKEQSEPLGNGNFPTVEYPNPEEPKALAMGIELAKKTNAELVLGTDPDSDRVGIAVKKGEGEYELLNGNQTAALLVDYVLSELESSTGIPRNGMVVKTIVTTELVLEQAKAKGVACYDVLTGFKYIAEAIRQKEGKEQFLVGGEESFGYLIGDYTRDKDAISAAAAICLMMAKWKKQGKSLLDRLHDLYLTYGYYLERLVSMTKKGKKGSEEIQTLMQRFREEPPKMLAREKVMFVKDYQKGEQIDLRNGNSTKISFPKSNVLQFFTEGGSKISIRPSGTEPKIKFYFGVKAEVKEKKDLPALTTALEEKIDRIKEDLRIV